MNAMHDPHLCQPDERKSCGACCGLYNYADSRREALVRRLRKRTALFRTIPKTLTGFHLYEEILREKEDRLKRYEVIYCCEYLGFLDSEERKVGCLLHPAQNGGEDFRQVSFYGQELCAGHFCTSYYYLSQAEKQSIINILDDWYLYGLVITDIDLVKSYFRLISDGIGEMPPATLFQEAPFKRLAYEFFALKVNWPFRSPEVHRFGKYYFDGSQYMINYIDYKKFNRPYSPFDHIFLSLSSEFKNGEEIDQAEEIVRHHIYRFIQAYERRNLGEKRNPHFTRYDSPTDRCLSQGIKRIL